MMVLALALMTVTAVSAAPQVQHQSVDAKSLIKTAIKQNTGKSYDQVKREQGIKSIKVKMKDIPADAVVIKVETPEELEALFQNNATPEDLKGTTETTLVSPDVKQPPSGNYLPQMGSDYTYRSYITSHKVKIYNGSLASVNLITSYTANDTFLDGIYIRRTFSNPTASTSYTGFTLSTSYSNNAGYPQSLLQTSQRIYSYTYGVLRVYILYQGIGEWMARDINGSDTIYA